MTTTRFATIESTESGENRRLLVAASHALLCDAIAAAATQAGFQVRTAPDGDSAFSCMLAWRPELVLVDLTLAAADDFELLRRAQQIDPLVSVVLISSDSTPSDLIIRGFVRGAIGVASKDRGVVSLMRVLNAVANGEAAIPRHLSRAIIRALQQATPASGSADAGLSERQREVLLLIADGLTDREISRQLSISLPTVRSHVEAIFQKTSTTNRTAAARWAHHYVSRLNGEHDDQPVHDSERSLAGAS